MQILNIIDDKDKMLSLAEMAKIDSSNFKNFEDRLSGYLAFHTAIYKDEVVAMSGIFQSKFWNKKLVRVLDRCYYFKQARSSSLSFLNEKHLKATASTHFLPLQTNIAIKSNLIPFWSIYGSKRRAALIKMVERSNKINSFKYVVLEGEYWTCNSEPGSNDGKCWQNIAVLDQYKNDFDLVKK